VLESAATVAAGPDAQDGSYPELKRGAELALEWAMPDCSLFARAGLILGPHENVGRLTWWLARMARGEEIMCPGPADMEIQYIDARDLARFVITAAAAGHTGPFNVVCRRGQVTMGSLLTTCHAIVGTDGAELTWVDPAAIAHAGLEAWTELPIWIPPDHDYAGMHDANVERAHQAGLACRSVHDTVADTWRWLSATDVEIPVRAGLPRPGLAADREQAVLQTWHTASS
jgi:2'-hydroxyisoflavone reductase